MGLFMLYAWLDNILKDDYHIIGVFCDTLNLTISNGEARFTQAAVYSSHHSEDLMLIGSIIEVICDDNTEQLGYNTIMCVDGLNQEATPSWNGSLPQCRGKFSHLSSGTFQSMTHMEWLCTNACWSWFWSLFLSKHQRFSVEHQDIWWETAFKFSRVYIRPLLSWQLLLK